MQRQLVPALVDGGLGIQGISQTPFYRFVSSAEGLSQLGIRPSDPPRLLEAYRKTVRVKRRGNIIELMFGDVRMLKLATPHFASGTGRLKVKSWLEWAVDGKSEPGFGYVPRPALPKNLQRNIRLSPPLGGLMLPRGSFRSSGMWSLPPFAQMYEIAWFQQNQGPIERAIEQALVTILIRQLRK